MIAIQLIHNKGENMYSIGVDIGGTGIKAGIVSENGQIIHRANYKSRGCRWAGENNLQSKL